MRSKPIHKIAYPYILLVIGLLIGLGIAIDWDLSFTWDVVIDGGISIAYEATEVSNKDGWDIASSIGALLGGLGTVGLLIFGWLKADSWIEQRKSDYRNDLLLSNLPKFEVALNDLRFDFNNTYSDKITDVQNQIKESLRKGNAFAPFNKIEAVLVKLDAKYTISKTVHELNKQINGCIHLCQPMKSAAKTYPASLKQISKIESKLESLKIELEDIEKVSPLEISNDLRELNEAAKIILDQTLNEILH